MLFFCQSCNSSLHSFSAHHQRLTLRSTTPPNISLPLLPQRFTCRRPRTQRPKMMKNREKFKSVSKIINGDYLQLVPEVNRYSGDEKEKDEDEEQLVQRVPVFNPILNNSKTQTSVNQDLNDEEELGNLSRKTFLRLDHDRVLSAWDSRHSPWISGRRNRVGVGILVKH